MVWFGFASPPEREGLGGRWNRWHRGRGLLSFQIRRLLDVLVDKRTIPRPRCSQPPSVRLRLNIRWWRRRRRRLRQLEGPLEILEQLAHGGGLVW